MSKSKNLAEHKGSDVPIRAYLAAERDRAGFTTRRVAEAFQVKSSSRTVTGMAGHWFEENLTRDECLAIISTPRDELEARYSTPPQDAAARPQIIGIGVFVTHASPGGYPRVLYLQRRAGASDGVGAWSVPGGRLEATDADVVACARRETLEETGLTLADVRVLPGHKLGRRPDGTPYLTVFVHTTVDASCIPTLEEDTNGWPVTRDMEPEKHHPWRWLTEGDLVELEGEVWDRELALQVLEALDAPKLQPDQARERNVD